jgi:hypothetical protein
LETIPGEVCDILPFLLHSLELDALYHIWYSMSMNDSLNILPARFFRTASGAEPVREWLKGLDKDDSRIMAGISEQSNTAGPSACLCVAPSKGIETFGRFAVMYLMGELHE